MKHPAEWIAFAVGAIATFVQAGILDEPTGAWLTAGVGLVAGITTGIVEWWRNRPGSVLRRVLGKR